MSFDVDCIVIGAGVIGLAVTRALAQAGLNVIVLEKETQFGTHTSSRNSEVIHAGIYYSKDSLKGHLCLQGRDLLYDYCQSHKVSCQKIGKLIVATDEAQHSYLQALQEKSLALGTGRLEWLTRTEAATIEPQLQCEAALLSRQTGIVDSHQYMLSLVGDIEMYGGHLASRARVTHIEALTTGYRLTVDYGENESYHISSKALVNCAGLFSWQVAAPLYQQVSKALPPRYLAKGTYFSYAKQAPFSHLIYPVPVDGGLGIHVTLDQGGGMRFGPDVEWVEEIDYTPSQRSKADFVKAIRRYFPALIEDDITEAFVGIRPKTSPPGIENDFLIDDLSEYGLDHCIHLFGIESPGLTASLAIANLIKDKLC